MNKKQLAGKLANQEKLTRTRAEKIIDSTLGIITQELIAKKKVRLVGFGNFVVRKRKGRIGRNPQTGSKITIGESVAPAFVPGINLKKAVKGK